MPAEIIREDSVLRALWEAAYAHGRWQTLEQVRRGKSWWAERGIAEATREQAASWSICALWASTLDDVIGRRPEPPYSTR